MYGDYYYREDKAQLNKLVEAVKTNFNERADEVRWQSCAFQCTFVLLLAFGAVLAIYNVFVLGMLKPDIFRNQ